MTHYIKVTFADERSAVYTTAILNLLMTDKYVIEIMDMETGEILLAR